MTDLDQDHPRKAIADALSESEIGKIMSRAVATDPRLMGATVLDLIDLADQHDSYVGVIDAFYDLPGHDEPVLAGYAPKFAMIALCLMGEALTVLNIKKLMLRAHLLPGQPVVLIWRTYTTAPMRAVTGYTAGGERYRYMVTHSPYGGVVLCRWPRNLTWGDFETMRQVAITSIQVGTADEGRRLADIYERGLSVPEAGPAWVQPGTPALRTATAQAGGLVFAEAKHWVPGDMEKAGEMIGWLMARNADYHCADGTGSETTLVVNGQTAQPGQWVARDLTGSFHVLDTGPVVTRGA